MIGVERSHLSRIESGDRNPSFDLLEKIAESLGATLSELFEGI